ncbi:hypothetical protein M0638_27390 [Roseomonas sp. NAR14]|uniref:Uncharacterized protein n=1 Tax=Roseomonas acroporae TaxID=2937791 RepID=A0A9X2C0G0_9PROT|nr:hypothetical protein [Roseomonas acroporae]MCK8788085.1 hypothetical protein [Roseomonas acroporae]
MSEATTTPDPASTPAASPDGVTSLLGDVAPAAPAEGQAPAPAAAEPEVERVGAPEGDYAYTPPEGVTLDQPMFETWTAQAREAGLTQKQFEALTPKAVELVSGIRAAQVEAWNGLQREWQATIAADKDLAGATPGTLAPEASAAANRFIAAHGGAELAKALALTGAGNHPAVVRAFVAAGKAMGDDTGALQPSKSPTSEGAFFDALYPSMRR